MQYLITRIFNHDLALCSTNEAKDYDEVYCKNFAYEKKIRDTEVKFSIEDYEVFQIIKR